MSVGVIGYSACHAGLNNQKLALLGLFVKALERSCAIALPELCNYSTSPAGAVSSIRFERVFDVPRLKAFGDAVGVPVLITPVFEPVSFDEGFQLGRQEDRSGLWDHESLSAQCWRALRPAPALAAVFHRVIEDLFARAGITAVARIRPRTVSISVPLCGRRALRKDGTRRFRCLTGERFYARSVTVTLDNDATK